MSRSFIYRLGSFQNSFVVATIPINFIYCLMTVEEKTITVKEKYTYSRYGFTEFMVIDEYNNHYNMNNSAWFFKWDSMEDWINIQTNKPIAIKYYGIRSPFLGLFPNIVNSTDVIVQNICY